MRPTKDVPEERWSIIIKKEIIFAVNIDR